MNSELRARKIAWGGLENHPFIAVVESGLSKFGFLGQGFDSDADSLHAYEFRRELFAGYDAVITILPQPHRQGVGEFGFIALLGVDSQRQREIENLLQVWECLNRVSGQEQEPLSEENSPVRVLTKQLSWLMMNWPPIVSVEAVAQMWVGIKNADFALAADDLLTYLAKQGMEFFSALESPTELASALQESTGGRSRMGALSQNAHIYAAVILADAGEAREALAELDKHLRMHARWAEVSEVAALSYEIEKDIVSRYRGWILSS